jgi:L-asparaginase
VASRAQVIVTSRCAEGFVRPVCGNGERKDLQKAEAIFAGELSGPKAPILALVFLRAGMNGDEISGIFAKFGR